MALVSIEKKVIKYFEQEYEWTCKSLDRNIAKPLEIVANAKQRLLGVSNFCQTLGIDYDFLEFLYNDYTERIENLIK